MTTRRNNSRKTMKFRKTYRRGVRRGGEGERDAIVDYKSARNDADWALTQSRKAENVPSRVWDKFPKNPFNSYNENIMKSYEHLRKGGKTKRKMRKYRK